MANRVMVRAIVAGLLAVAGATAARADFVIDTFVTPNPRITYALDAPATSSYTRTDTLNDGTSDITRTLVVSQTENRDGNVGATDGNIGKTTAGTGGQFVLNTAAGTTSTALLTYDYGRSARNLAAGGSDIRFAIIDTDLATPFSVRISDGTKSAVVTRTVLTSAAETVVLPVSEFAGKGVDLTKITSVQLLLNGDLSETNPVATKRSADLTISDVRITTVNPPAVPAPAALALVAAAVPALGFARRFRK